MECIVFTDCRLFKHYLDWSREVLDRPHHARLSRTQGRPDKDESSERNALHGVRLCGLQRLHVHLVPGRVPVQHAGDPLREGRPAAYCEGGSSGKGPAGEGGHDGTASLRSTRLQGGP